MKLCRIRTSDGVRPALYDETGTLRDLSDHIADIDPDATSPRGLAALQALDPAALPVITGSYAPILSDVRRILCIGLNFTDHAIEANLPIPDYPVLFMKGCPATGANDPVIIPKGATKTDWEVELGMVIGSEAKHVSEARALDYVAGYCITNDVSERRLQMEMGGQWTKGKSCDSFAPVGPWLVTKDEVPDPQNLDMTLEVNGVRRQTGNTATMIFSLKHIIAFLSDIMTLRPGDIIMTGTPPGVGMGHDPQVFLKPGDEMRLTITGLGEQVLPVVAYADT